jgi:hypothetical protein
MCFIWMLQNLIWCCICCNGYTRMFQMYVSNVSAISYVYCKCFYLDVAYVTVAIHICCKRMFHLFWTYVAASASCCKYFH